jgi:hypothetical protein
MSIICLYIGVVVGKIVFGDKLYGKKVTPPFNLVQRLKRLTFKTKCFKTFFVKSNF